MKLVNTFVVSLLAASCAPQYARKVEYRLNNGYSDARSKISAYHNDQVSGFGMFRDRTTVTLHETIPGKQSAFSVTHWAPDIGTVPSHSSVLSHRGKGCTYTVVEEKNPRVVYDAPRAMFGSKLGPLSDIDEWVTTNLQVGSREVGESRNTVPLHKMY